MLNGLLLPKHQKLQCLTCVRATHLPQRATEDSPGLMCCICLSPECNALYQCWLAQKGSILISRKKWLVHIIVTIFSFHCPSDIKRKRKEKKSSGSLQGRKKKHHLISVWGVYLIPICSHSTACKKIFVWYKGRWIIYAIFNNAVNQGEFSKTGMALYIICLARLAFPNKPPHLKTISTRNITKKKYCLIWKLNKASGSSS